MEITEQALTGKLIGLYTVELGGKLENDRKKWPVDLWSRKGQPPVINNSTF
jgi:hypothetical protein